MNYREKIQKILREKFGIEDALFQDFKTPKDVIEERNHIEKTIIKPFLDMKLP